MIKLFRNIRKTLLNESKTTNYLKYALGEIILVVIGILIALQINNWNERRKQHQEMIVALESFTEDLQLDSLQLQREIKQLDSSLAETNKIKNRLSQPTANMDTLRHIARYDFVPFFDPSHEINRNTIVSLLSTGKIDYFDNDLKKSILKLNAFQLKSLKIMNENVSIYLNSQYHQNFIIQGQSVPFLSSAVIKGPLLETYWKNLDNDQLLKTMLNKITGKIIMERILAATKEDLLQRTNDMLEKIHKTFRLEN